MRQRLDYYLSEVRSQKEILIISGAAKGADALGERYAKENGFDIDLHPANWDRYGKQAGYIRNAEMANVADALIAFWDGKSKGTEMMINLAQKKGLKVKVVRY